MYSSGQLIIELYSALKAVFLIVYPSEWLCWYHEIHLLGASKTFDAIHLEMKRNVFLES
jgi:hypothetical protein